MDHINIRVADPRPLFSLLTDRLGLPVLWSPAALPGFEIAGVGVGNVHVEPTRYGLRSNPRAAAKARLFSICFEPEPVELAAEELSRRGIPHTSPVPYLSAFPPEAETKLFHRIGPAHGRDHLWTWILIGGFLGDRMLARQYSSRLFQSGGFGRGMGRLLGSRSLGTALSTAMAPRRPYPFFVEWKAFDIGASRARAREELESRDGGPLGVVRMSEVVVGASDPEVEVERWGKLLDPAPRTADGAWELGDGPAVRVVADGEDRLRSLVLQVASLERAERFLRDEGMLGPAAEGQVTIEPRSVFGLDVRLAEGA